MHQGRWNGNRHRIDLNLRFDGHHIRSVMRGDFEHGFDGVDRAFRRISRVGSPSNHRAFNLQTPAEIVQRDEGAGKSGGVAGNHAGSGCVEVFEMVGRRGVGHPRHGVFFPTLEDVLHTGSEVGFFVRCPDLAGRTIHHNVGNSEKIAKATVTLVACLAKSSNSVGVIEGAIQGKPFANRQIATKRGACFGDANDDHVVLRINSICNAFSNCPVSVDGDFNGHDLLHALLIEPVNKGFFASAKAAAMGKQRPTGSDG